MSKKHKFHFFALAATGKGLSGSDRIFIELARNWSAKHPVVVYAWEEGKQMCVRQKLDGKYLSYHEIILGKLGKVGFLANYFARIVAGIRLGLSINLDNNQHTYVYSTNDFWMDLLPGWLLKMRFSKITWISSFYLAAPNPFVGFDETDRAKFNFPSFKLIVYWLQQQPTYHFTKHWADYVFVTSMPDAVRFPKQNGKKKVVVVRGGVRLDEIEQYIKKQKSVSNKEFDAVFQGRFHPQKGVVELVDIWKEVVDRRSDAMLAMIGDGPLMEDVQFKINELGLEKNIKLFGYVFDGDKKYKIFSQSKMVVHPAFYDSGGMAAAEAMAFGLPAVGFNLKAYETYYPKGMVKVKPGNLHLFAERVIRFIEDEEYRIKIAGEAKIMIKNNWVWATRAEEVFEYVTK